VADGNVYAYRFRGRDGEAGYWRDVGTIDSYWLAHQELLAPNASVDLENSDWPILGRGRPAGPAHLTATANVVSTMLGAGCVVAGKVEGSVLSTGCRVGEGSVVTDSVLLPQSSVGQNCRLERVIIDSHCHVPDNLVIDAGVLDATEQFYVSPNGVVVVTKDLLAHDGVAANRRIA
jgi:glucose-1-phosphate adenylyltransferase